MGWPSFFLASTIHLTQFTPLLFHIILLYLSKLTNSCWCITIIKLKTLFEFHHLFIGVPLSSTIPSRVHTEFNCCVSPFSPAAVSFFLIIINLFFIGVQFANIQNNTRCSSRQVPPSVPVTHSPPPLPSSPSTTLSSFPRVRRLPCSVSLSDISYPFLLPSLIFPFTIIYIPQMNENMWSVYTLEYSSAIRNDKYPPFASTWMELEGIMLSEVSQSEKDKQCMFSFIWGI